MRKLRIDLGFEIITPTILICCAWGKVNWWWFWGILFLEFILNLTVYLGEKKRSA